MKNKINPRTGIIEQLKSKVILINQHKIVEEKVPQFILLEDPIIEITPTITESPIIEEEPIVETLIPVIETLPTTLDVEKIVLPKKGKRSSKNRTKKR